MLGSGLNTDYRRSCLIVPEIPFAFAIKIIKNQTVSIKLLTQATNFMFSIIKKHIMIKFSVPKISLLLQICHTISGWPNQKINCKSRHPAYGKFDQCAKQFRSAYCVDHPTSWPYCHCPRGSKPYQFRNRFITCIPTGPPKACCRNGYHQDPTTRYTTCKINQCQCQNGIGASGRDCKINNDFTCQSCDQGYHLYLDLDKYTTLCDENICTCDNGEAATFDSWTHCREHNGNYCQSCSEGYFLDGLENGGHVCTLKGCTCENGVGSTGTDCPNDGEFHCSQCNSGYSLKNIDNTKKCNPNVCTCKDGVPVIPGTATCNSDGANVCQTCNTGYWLNGFQCRQKICNCPNGIGSTGVDCPSNGQNHCQNCDDYYHESNNRCYKNVCTCTNGYGYGSSSDRGLCSTHGSHKCHSCHSGYIKTNNNRCIESIVNPQTLQIHTTRYVEYLNSAYADDLYRRHEFNLASNVQKIYFRIKSFHLEYGHDDVTIVGLTSPYHNHNVLVSCKNQGSSALTSTVEFCLEEDMSNPVVNYPIGTWLTFDTSGVFINHYRFFRIIFETDGSVQKTGFSIQLQGG